MFSQSDLSVVENFLVLDPQNLPKDNNLHNYGKEMQLLAHHLQTHQTKGQALFMLTS